MTTQAERAKEQLLTVPEVAEQLSVGVATVWRLISSGALDSIKIGGARRIRQEALAEYIERQTERRNEEGA